MARYPDIKAGNKITGALLRSMLPDKTVKQSATDLTSNTTLANDPELSGITLGVGTWEVRVVIFATSAGTANIKTRWSFTGTWANAIRAVVGPGLTATGGPTDATTMKTNGQSVATDAIYALTNSSNYAVIKEECSTVVVTVTGDMALQWAQQVSSANTTSVKAGSYIEVKQIA